MRADIARASRNQNVFRDSVIHLTLAIEATSGSPLLSDQDFLSLKYSHRSAHRGADQAAEKPGHKSVELREMTKDARRVPRRNTSRRDILGDDAACTDYGAGPDADAGQDDHF